MNHTVIPDGGKIHIIGIAGSAIAPVAIMMRQKGWEVSGSDQNVFEPALSLLTNNDIKWSEGYDAKRVEGVDLVMIGGGPLIANIENSEFIRAKELKLPMVTFAELLGKYLAKKESIVVTGAYGKTTTTAMIAKILDTAKKNPSFMIGGKPIDFPTGVEATDSEFSVIEGDEFPAAYGFDWEPKYMYYKPKYAILSATKWDHLDVYTTEQSYIDAFIKLAKLVEEREDSSFIMCASGENNEKVAAEFNGNLITYMLDSKKNLLENDPEFLATNIKFGEELTSFEVLHAGESLGQFETPMIGLHNVENCLAAIVTTYDAGIEIEDIVDGLREFGGIKRRQELVGKTKSGALVMDDFAHSPIKAQSTLEALRTRYPNKHIIAIYQPRMSERGDRKVLDWYPEAFKLADDVIVPKITVKSSVAKEDRIRGKDLVDAIKEGNPNAYYMPKDEQITEFISEKADEDSLVVFMSAGGWGDTMTGIIKS